MLRKVFVELNGEQIDIDDLLWALNTSEWKITKENDQYYLNSKLLDSIEETDLIASFAAEFLDKINGASSVIHSNHRKVHIGNIKIIEPDATTHHVILCGPSEIRARSRLRAVLTTKSDPDPKTIPTDIETWLTKSINNDNITEALHYFNQITWYNLFKIYEVIQRDLSQNKVDINKFCSGAQLKKFTRNSNMVRHAKMFEPPKIEMTINEGYEFIARLFQDWIRTK